MKRHLVVVCLAGFVPLLAAAGGVKTFKGIARVASYTCEGGQDVRVIGTGHGLDLNGACGTVTLDGSGHVVSLEGVEKLVLVGAGHVVTYETNGSDETTLPIDNRAAGAVVTHVVRR